MIDMFDYFDVLFPVLIALAFGVFGFAVARGIVTWNKNNHSPRITAPAVIVAKRTNVTHLIMQMPGIRRAPMDSIPTPTRHIM